VSTIEHVRTTTPTTGRRTGPSAAPVSGEERDRGLARGGAPARVLRVLGIVASLRQDSYNDRLMKAAGRRLPGGVRMTVYDGLKHVPPFDEDDELRPAPAVEELRRQIAAADAVLISTPEYNDSLPGQLKNALDWASRPYATNVLRDKPVAVIGASPSRGGTAHANADARRVLARIGARVIEPTVLVAGAHEQLRSDNGLVSEPLGRGLATVLSALLAAVQSPPATAA